MKKIKKRESKLLSYEEVENFISFNLSFEVLEKFNLKSVSDFSEILKGIKDDIIEERYIRGCITRAYVSIMEDHYNTYFDAYKKIIIEDFIKVNGIKISEEKINSIVDDENINSKLGIKAVAKSLENIFLNLKTYNDACEQMEKSMKFKGDDNLFDFSDMVGELLYKHYLQEEFNNTFTNTTFSQPNKYSIEKSIANTIKKVSKHLDENYFLFLNLDSLLDGKYKRYEIDRFSLLMYLSKVIVDKITIEGKLDLEFRKIETYDKILDNYMRMCDIGIGEMNFDAARNLKYIFLEKYQISKLDISTDDVLLNELKTKLIMLTIMFDKTTGILPQQHQYEKFKYEYMLLIEDYIFDKIKLNLISNGVNADFLTKEIIDIKLNRNMTAEEALSYVDNKVQEFSANYFRNINSCVDIIMQKAENEKKLLLSDEFAMIVDYLVRNSIYKNVVSNSGENMIVSSQKMNVDDAMLKTEYYNSIYSFVCVKFFVFNMHLYDNKIKNINHAELFLYIKNSFDNGNGLENIELLLSDYLENILTHSQKVMVS